MQSALTTTVLPVVAAGALTHSALLTPRPPILAHLFRRIQLSLVPFTAHDVYLLCSTAGHHDSLGMMSDADLMRAIRDAFVRADQSLLTPFQTSFISDTLRRAGVVVEPRAVTIPDEEEAITPESLLAVLHAMCVTRTRDERTIEQVMAKMNRLLNDFVPLQLAQVVIDLGTLRYPGAELMTRLTQRLLPHADELRVSELTAMCFHLARTPGVPRQTVSQLYQRALKHVSEFDVEDYEHILRGLCILGPSYRGMFNQLVTHGLDFVETMNALTLTHYLHGFTVMDYRERAHIEVYADALVDVASELGEKELIDALVSLHRLNMLGALLFDTMQTCVMRYAARLSLPYAIRVMDVCSQTPHSSEELMTVLMHRLGEGWRSLTALQLGAVLDVLALYPPARQHALVPLLGRLARVRLEVMSPTSLAQATRGLAQLGYDDAEYYRVAAETGFRYGFKDWTFLEPIVMGLCLSGDTSITMVKTVAAYLSPMTRSMSVAEIERAYGYLRQLRCEEEFIYRSMATRVTQFVKEVTPDMSEALQALLQRAALLQ